MGREFRLLMIPLSLALLSAGCSKSEPPVPISKSQPKPGDAPTAFNVNTAGWGETSSEFERAKRSRSK